MNLTNRAAFGVLALACVIAAGGGAYLATRHNDAASEGFASGPDAEFASAALSSEPEADQVTESEFVVEDLPEPVEEPSAVHAATSDQIERRAAARPSEPEPARVAAPSETASRPVPSPRPRPSRVEEPRSEPAPAHVQSAPSVPEAISPAVETRPEVETAVIDLPPAPLEPTLIELTVAADSVLGLQIDSSVTSDRARVEDRVDARVTREVSVGDEVAIPAGSLVEGSVTLVERGGKLKERARLGVRFHTIVLADGTTVPFSTETVFREGASPAGESTAKIGGAAVGGAILGAILGGGKGATIGSAVGAAGGTAAVMAGERHPATFPAGSTVTVRILSPVTVTVED